MQTIPAREIKRRGIGSVDEALKCGPVHVIKNDELRYVILTEERYRELMEEVAEAELIQVRESLEDVKAGRVRRVTVEDMRPYLRAANVTWKGLDLTDVKEMDFQPSEEEFETIGAELAASGLSLDAND